MLMQIPYVHSAACIINKTNTIESLSDALSDCDSFPHSPKEVATLQISVFLITTHVSLVILYMPIPQENT